MKADVDLYLTAFVVTDMFRILVYMEVIMKKSIGHLLGVLIVFVFIMVAGLAACTEGAATQDAIDDDTASIDTDKSISETKAEVNGSIQSSEDAVAEAVAVREAEGWSLVFADEFNGDGLDKTVWSHQEGTGSQFGLTDWGNGEAQFYSQDNVAVSDGNLIIEARKEASSGKSYTSGRITTKDGFSKAYGRFEASISFPAGEGLWPAFWMLPQEEAYGTWAASGEIDIVEVRGRFPKNVNAALHYGGQWPDNEYSSAYMKLEETVESYHTYAIEWEPGEIRWYVNDELYYTANDWYSVSDGEIDSNTYPAPFDKPFYLLLNLAVGGTYDEHRLPKDTDLPAVMKVDYVRVYELTGRPYMEPVMPVAELGEYSESAKEPVEGNFIYDTAYQGPVKAVTSSGAELDSDLWNVVAISDFGGAVTHSVADTDGGPALRMDISSPGHEAYAVQLIQHVPLAQNRVYELTFMARADAAREMKIKIGAGATRGWKMYAPDTTVSLTQEMQTYSLKFKMKDNTDEMARLEFNCGLSAKAVEIANVSLREVE